jgi:uncharacterized NAD(P)/FAD-binding protein YdhS
MNTVAIIGGGFSGTMTAVNLARFADQPLRVVVINGRRPFGRGTAYGTNRSEHLLNVAARNMSAFPDHPEHFVEWLRTRSEFDEVPEAELREMFVPRRIYGDYIRSLAAIYLHPMTLDIALTLGKTGLIALLKGSLWETTAVPELRGQAMRVAQLILEQEPLEAEEEYVIEYCI